MTLNKRNWKTIPSSCIWGYTRFQMISRSEKGNLSGRNFKQIISVGNDQCVEKTEPQPYFEIFSKNSSETRKAFWTWVLRLSRRTIASHLILLSFQQLDESSAFLSSFDFCIWEQGKHTFLPNLGDQPIVHLCACTTDYSCNRIFVFDKIFSNIRQFDNKHPNI